MTGLDKLRDNLEMLTFALLPLLNIDMGTIYLIIGK